MNGMNRDAAWRSFKGVKWTDDVNVRDFIQNNYMPYDGDESFLVGPTEATDKLWGKVQELQKEERKRGGVLECETEVVSGITAYGPGYIDASLKDLEQVVGLQTDKPLKRAFMPFGGIRMAEEAAKTYGYEVNPKFHKIFTEYHKTHNQAVFDAYTPEMRRARHSHIVTGLPDTYGRGRIVGDYRRVALYGIDFLIEKKSEDLANCGCGIMTDDIIRQREELAEQIRALKQMKEMAKAYGYDISIGQNAKRPSVALLRLSGSHQDAGRLRRHECRPCISFLVSTSSRDLAENADREAAQELIDGSDAEVRMVRLPASVVQSIFSGDVGDAGWPASAWMAASWSRARTTLPAHARTWGKSPRSPNLTVLYSPALPAAFKKYAARISIETSSIQYENDDVMKPVWGDDYSICCCVSATQTGKEMQFFGARANLAKCLLYAINGGKDEKFLTKDGKHMQVGPEYMPITSDVLDYDEVLHRFDQMMDWLAGLYVNILNLIQYMHDKYYYEAAEMALIDTDVRRTFATGIAGFSHVVDSLCAIKYAKVSTIRDESGLVVDYKVEEATSRIRQRRSACRQDCHLAIKTFMTKLLQASHTATPKPRRPSTAITSACAWQRHGLRAGWT